ncbi:MAG: ABC transporter permease, partial [Pseudomonadota bacterium]
VSGSLLVGVIAGTLAAVAVSLIFGLLTLSLMANQVATGLALTIFGIGLSAFVGKPYESATLAGMKDVAIPLLSDIPILGTLIFHRDPLFYLSLVMFGVVTWFLFRTRGGLVLRAVGESHDAAHALGYPVIKIRYLAVIFGAAMAGLGGAYLSLVLTPQWQEDMTAQRGWIALALVVFATWRPARVLIGAWLFGGLTILNFAAQGRGIDIPAEFLAIVPYVATILVLVLISRDATKIRLNAPASLGKPFHASD